MKNGFLGRPAPRSSCRSRTRPVKPAVGSRGLWHRFVAGPTGAPCAISAECRFRCCIPSPQRNRRLLSIHPSCMDRWWQSEHSQQASDCSKRPTPASVSNAAKHQKGIAPGATWAGSFLLLRADHSSSKPPGRRRVRRLSFSLAPEPALPRRCSRGPCSAKRIVFACQPWPSVTVRQFAVTTSSPPANSRM